MQIEQPWYIGLRSKALAIVSLTERDDLIVYRDTKDYDLDVLVSISKNGEDINRLFGVEIKAVKSTPKIIQNDAVFNIEGADVDVLQSRLKKCNFPICLFFFTLDNDNGYYKWISEPILDNENSNKLKFNRSPEFRELTKEAINDIVSLINQWYENQRDENQPTAHITYVRPLRKRYHASDDINYEISQISQRERRKVFGDLQQRIKQNYAAKDDINHEVNKVKS
ncbi:DUF4365 domain-containing protein [Dolichospermum sp. FACHB-1091]|uniref:DUF4365 domain-containing protein n=1 Tax=Dolichospermum sp. FACHB-1091 TaxID=2692798 RepID=UPI0016801DF4|nr:DUF4365 domain-containing protein [Dolichospermum sp. FACHB-1091]MBD2443160.1 DUF4365 domain-containing protein [Dolichospermum sp. FACHB-1091]